MRIVLYDDHRSIELLGRQEDIPNGPDVLQICAFDTRRAGPQRCVAVTARQRACCKHHCLELAISKERLCYTGLKADVYAKPLHHLDLPTMDLGEAAARGHFARHQV